MKTNAVIVKTGLTYGQLNYLLKQVNALNRDKTQGKAREYSFRDLVYLKIAAVMRSDGMGLTEINQALNALDQNWGKRGAVMRNGVDSSSGWEWLPNMDLVTTDSDNKPKRIPRIPRYMYDVSYYVSELRKGDQMELIQNEP